MIWKVSWVSIVIFLRILYYILKLFQQYDFFCTLIGHHNPLSSVIKPVLSLNVVQKSVIGNVNMTVLSCSFCVTVRRWSGNFQIIQIIKTIENKLKFLTFCLIIIHCHYILWILKSTFIMKLRYTLKIK
jgi:hypothetical protein